MKTKLRYLIRQAAPLVTCALLAAACGEDVFEGNKDGGDGGAVGDAVAFEGGMLPDLYDPYYYTDQDGDGYSRAQGDCNDTDKKISPAAKEICDDNMDNDCNGKIDTWELDADGDGYGPCGGDCDDTDKKINPQATEIEGDKIDNNCDGFTDDDYDGDGIPSTKGDCNDKDATIYPGAVEHCYDKVDNNCNGKIDAKEPDADGDGYGPCGGDCDDTNKKVYPGAKEIAGDGVDNNCDYLVDEDIDGDGWTTANGDCDDANAKAYPGAAISCSATGTTDLNCNKVADKNENYDQDNDGVKLCDGDCDDKDPSRSPTYFEVPSDKIDNDCDGKVDNVAACDGGASIDEAQAMDLCDKGVTITRGGDATAQGTRQSAFGAISPRSGKAFFTLSTGKAWDTALEPGTKMLTTGNPVTITGCFKCTTAGSNQWEHMGPAGCCEDNTENDPSYLTLQIKVPGNAKGFKFDFIYLSSEYPEYVHSKFNDTFYAIESSTSLTNVQNISFDSKGQPLTVNNGWFEDPSSPTQSLTGTGYDTYGSSSGWLETTAPATPGETMTLTFWVHDESDMILDSSTIIDNWRWVATQVNGPSTIK